MEVRDAPSTTPTNSESETPYHCPTSLDTLRLTTQISGSAPPLAASFDVLALFPWLIILLVLSLSLSPCLSLSLYVYKHMYTCICICLAYST